MSSFKRKLKAQLQIDLINLVKNYNLLKKKLSPGSVCSAVMKANAYGLGSAEIYKTLYKNGCEDFFVAHLEEGIILKEANKTKNIYLLHGLYTNEEIQACITHNLIPVLNSIEQITLLNCYLKRKQKQYPAIIHVDTGMSRLGLSQQEILHLIKHPELLNHLDIKYVLSHLACADNYESPYNKEQLELFKNLTTYFPNTKMSLSNSSGIFLGKEYHFNLVRPGGALYGINPTPYKKNPMDNVVTLKAPILRKTILDKDQYVSYGATYKMKKNDKIITIEWGYADGFLLSQNNEASCYVDGGYYLPIAGKVTMDMIMFDASALPQQIFNNITSVELIGPHLPVDEVAKKAKTVGYEIIAAIGGRVNVNYIK